MFPPSDIMQNSCTTKQRIIAYRDVARRDALNAAVPHMENEPYTETDCTIGTDGDRALHRMNILNASTRSIEDHMFQEAEFDLIMAGYIRQLHHERLALSELISDLQKRHNESVMTCAHLKCIHDVLRKTSSAREHVRHHVNCCVHPGIDEAMASMHISGPYSGMTMDDVEHTINDMAGRLCGNE